MQRTRWGSCSTLNNLNFNLRVIALPKSLREYIVVHEVAHLREQNHSQRFWRLVADRCPDYLEAEAELRRYWVILERNRVWRRLQDCGDTGSYSSGIGYGGGCRIADNRSGFSSLRDRRLSNQYLQAAPRSDEPLRGQIPGEGRLRKTARPYLDAQMDWFFWREGPVRCGVLHRFPLNPL